jgi:predicted kinase
MCGPAGSGKSTYARTLEDEGFTRLSIDEEAWRRGYRSQPLPDPTAEEIERELRSRLVPLLSEARDVVVDLSFWSRAMRQKYRELAQACGALTETVYFDTPRGVVLERVRARGGASPNEVRLAEKPAAAYFDGFEVPTADEGPLRVIAYEGGDAE